MNTAVCAVCLRTDIVDVAAQQDALPLFYFDSHVHLSIAPEPPSGGSASLLTASGGGTFFRDLSEPNLRHDLFVGSALCYSSLHLWGATLSPNITPTKTGLRSDPVANCSLNKQNQIDGGL